LSIEKEMATAIRELLEQELAPIREKLQKIEPISKEDLDEMCASFQKDLSWLVDWKADIERKFVITGKLIDSVMTAVEKTSSAKKCEDDLKGLRILKGEEVE